MMIIAPPTKPISASRSVLTSGKGEPKEEESWDSLLATLAGTLGLDQQSPVMTAKTKVDDNPDQKEETAAKATKA